MLRVDEEVMARIESWAQDEFRSVNGQIEWILNQSLKKAGRNKAENSTEDLVEDQENKEDLLD